MKVYNCVNGGRREGGREDNDCVLRSLNSTTHYQYEELQKTFADRGREEGQGTKFIPRNQRCGVAEDFSDLGYDFKAVPGPYKTPIRDLALDRNKRYIVDFHGDEIHHLAAVVDGTLWDDQDALGIEDSIPAGIWEVRRQDAGLTASAKPGIRFSGPIIAGLLAKQEREQRKSDIAAKVAATLKKLKN